MEEEEKKKEEEEMEEVQELSTMLNKRGMEEDVVDDMKTMFHQDLLAMKEAKEKGLDVNDGFRVIRCGSVEDNKPLYRVFGVEGREEKVEDELKRMKRSRYTVDNESVPNYKEKRKKKRWEEVLGPSLEKNKR